MGDYNLQYLYKLRTKYNILKTSRLVVKGDKDKEALDYFQKNLNDSIYTNEHEYEITAMIKNLYYADKASFNRCARKEPALILLTENRNIVVHFKIQDIIFIQWTGNDYVVQENDIMILSDKSEKRNKKFDKKQTNKKIGLMERINNIENKLKINSENEKLENNNEDNILNNDNENLENKKQNDKKQNDKKQNDKKFDNKKQNDKKFDNKKIDNKVDIKSDD